MIGRHQRFAGRRSDPLTLGTSVVGPVGPYREKVEMSQRRRIMRTRYSANDLAGGAVAEPGVTTTSRKTDAAPDRGIRRRIRPVPGQLLATSRRRVAASPRPIMPIPRTKCSQSSASLTGTKFALLSALITGP